ncbi:protein rep [Phaeodactylibacter xiamenensis]|uniref:protein rep n=1 Tax=Phaeodactylibacter xiamenensis TaxID=1524460 RepID=UPI003CCBCC5E
MCLSNTSIEPCFNTLETNGSWTSEPEIGVIGVLEAKRYKAPEQLGEDVYKAARNGMRALRMITGKHEAMLWRDQISDWLAVYADELTAKQVEELFNLRCSLASCCQTALFRNHVKNDAKEFLAAYTCKHKCCPVCNANRSKKTRLKYIKFFEKNPDILRNYDFMHLTLTVPHSPEGGRFEGFYSKELMQCYNQMRKRKFWKERVYAGMLSVEVTKNESGLHVHIHSLLLVRKKRQNRNELYREVLLAWNEITGSQVAGLEISDEVRSSIKEVNKGRITDQDIDQMDASGSTFIGLENLYIITKSGKKRYVKPKDEGLFIAGIMECIKYHFQPIALKKDGTLDVELLTEILPAIKRQPLHKKFGAFHSGTKNAHPDAKMLNVNNAKEEDEEDLKEMLEETGSEIKNPVTGEPASREDYEYFSTSLSNVFVDRKNNNRIDVVRPDKVRYLHRSVAPNALSALKYISKKGAMDAWRHKRMRRIMGKIGYEEVNLQSLYN